MLRFANYCLIAVFLLSCSQKKDQDKKQQEMGKKMVFPVQSIIVKPQILEYTIHSSGTIFSNEEIELKSEISGRIVSINFKEGQSVSKGALLVKIYDSDLRAQLKKAKLQEELAAVEESRNRVLLDQKGISQQEYDVVLNTLNSCKADEDILLTQIRKTEIIAPFSGTIGLRYVSEGSYVQPTTLLAVLQQTDPVKIEFSVPEKYTSYLKAGTKISFTTNLEKTYEAFIYATNQKVDINTRTLIARARCNNHNNELIPGSFVKVDIILDKINNAIVVPTEAVVPVLGGQITYLYKSGKAISTKVVTGIRTENTVQILNGVNEADTVITTGLMILRNGTNVKLQKSGEEGIAKKPNL